MSWHQEVRQPAPYMLLYMCMCYLQRTLNSHGQFSSSMPENFKHDSVTDTLHRSPLAHMAGYTYAPISGCFALKLLILAVRLHEHS